MSVDIRIRRMRPDDTAFVIDTWVETFRNTYAAGVVPMKFYQADYRKYVATLLADREPDVLVAYDAAAEVAGAELLGYLVFETSATFPAGRRMKTVGPVVHYCYVKEYMRGHGLARALFAAAKIDQHGELYFTFKPTEHDRKPDAKKWKDTIPRARWNPLIARYPKTTTPTEQTTNEAQAGEVSRERRHPG
jgi:hypothetical protein